jgi:hypothetical protein
MFNKFLYQNKFVIEKQIKFVIETDTHKIYWTIYIKKILQSCIYEKSYKKSILKTIYIKLRKNQRWIILTSLKTKYTQYHLKISQSN